MNSDRELQAKDEGIRQLKLMTSSFKRYLENYDLFQGNDNFTVQSPYLTNNRCVLPGSKLFEIMFYGTKFTDVDTKT